MHLELTDIKDGCLQKELVCVATEFPVLMEMEQCAEAQFVRPIKFQLRLQQLGQLVEVDGHFSTEVVLNCGHCLQSYQKDLVGDFAFTFTPYVAQEQDKVDEDAEVELETDELGLVFYTDECLDLSPPLQDQLIMAMPISPICGDNCKGLCSECGENLNSNDCHCAKKLFNSKFTALAGLKIAPSDKKG